MGFKTSIPPFFRQPKLLVREPKLTVRQLASQVSEKTRMKSRIVGVESVSTVKVPKMLEGYTGYRVQTRNTKNGNQYRLLIFSPTPNITRDTKVVVDSPNPLYVFRYEVANAKRGNGFIYRSNGDPPVTTNPRLIPGIDHHLYKALQYLIKVTTAKGLPNKEMVARDPVPSKPQSSRAFSAPLSRPEPPVTIKTPGTRLSFGKKARRLR